MNPGRFFIPNMVYNPMITRNLSMLPQNTNIFSRLFNNIKTINFSKLLTGANKTLNIMNQAIPLIRQTGPLINNAKSMLSIAKAFKAETTPKSKRNINNNHYNNSNIINNKTNNTIKTNNDVPTFFI